MRCRKIRNITQQKRKIDASKIPIQTVMTLNLEIKRLVIVTRIIANLKTLNLLLMSYNLNSWNKQCENGTDGSCCSFVVFLLFQITSVMICPQRCRRTLRTLWIWRCKNMAIYILYMRYQIVYCH